MKSYLFLIVTTDQPTGYEFNIHAHSELSTFADIFRKVTEMVLFDNGSELRSVTFLNAIPVL